MDLDRRLNMASRLRTHDSVTTAHHAQPALAFPTGLTPKPVPAEQHPDTANNSAPAGWHAGQSRVIVMVDTADEVDAAAAVFTPGIPRQGWHAYTKNFYSFQDQLTDRSPARMSHRLGSYCFTKIGEVPVMVYKTELHMHEDGPTIPLKSALKQLISDMRPTLFLTTGTSGGVFDDLSLGSVTVSRCAQFHCKKDYANAPFNNKRYDSRHWSIPERYMGDARRLMQNLNHNLRDAGAPPQTTCSAPQQPPAIRMCESWPVLTTDYFEFGTTANRLDRQGCCVEMDDAVLGLVCDDLGAAAPCWGSVRNVSDPVINGSLPDTAQDQCAEFYYKQYGYWTSINSALVAWAIIAGLN